MNSVRITIVFGALAALFFLGAALVGMTRMVVPKKRLRLHRTLAFSGLLAALIHIILVLRMYITF